MPFFDFDFDIQVFEIQTTETPDFGEADPGYTEDSPEDVTDILSLHSAKAPGGSLAWDDDDQDAFKFVASKPGSGTTMGSSGQQGPDVNVYTPSASSISSASSAVG